MCFAFRALGAKVKYNVPPYSTDSSYSHAWWARLTVIQGATHTPSPSYSRYSLAFWPPVLVPRSASRWSGFVWMRGELSETSLDGASYGEYLWVGGSVHHPSATHVAWTSVRQGELSELWPFAVSPHHEDPPHVYPRSVGPLKVSYGAQFSSETNGGEGPPIRRSREG